MTALTEEQVSDLEQRDFVIDRDEDGRVVSVTQIIDPGPLVVAEYLQQLFEVQGIMRAMHDPGETREEKRAE